MAESETQASSRISAAEQIKSLALNLRASSADLSSNGELRRLLLLEAESAAEQSYSPYSKFPVGAALLARDGTVFTGCNVENASFGGTICAERTAFVKAVSEGYREFEMIAVFCKKAKDAWPCGFCRQFMSEFGSSLKVIAYKSEAGVQVRELSELLPFMFGPGAMGQS
ncbi:MAG: cytidine deaminase [Candidatus Obscuribacterales bacterium]|nr:cytidine deaminase [Candidatus Obscuribacterales bacterium]